MAQKPSFLKRITTASTVAFAAAAIVGSAGSAMAQQNRVTNAAATTVDGVGFDAGGAVTANAVITATDPNNITFNTPNGQFNGIYLNNAANVGVIIDENTTLGFVNNTANNANIFNFTLNADRTFAITGQGITADNALLTRNGAGVVTAFVGGPINNNDISGLGSVTFDPANTSVLSFTSADATKVMTATNFKVANGVNATINIKNNGATDPANLDALVFVDASVATAKTINVAAGSLVRFNSTETAGDALNLQQAANDTINLANNATLHLQSKNGGGNAQNFIVANGNLGGRVGDGGDNNGIIHFDTTDVAGSFGLVAPGETAVVGIDATHRAQQFKVTAAVGNNATITNQIFAKNVTFNGGNNIFQQAINVGEEGSSTFTASSKVSINATSNLGAVSFGAFADSFVVVDTTGGAVTLTGNFIGDATAANFPVIVFFGGNDGGLTAANADADVVTNVKAIENVSGAPVTLGAGNYTTDLNFTKAGSSFILAEGFNLIGNVNIKTVTKNALEPGIITLQGNATITGNIGADAKGAITAINLGGNNLSYGGGAAFVKGINFAKNETLAITNNNSNVYIGSDVSIANAGNNGVINADAMIAGKTLAISGAIGNAANSLASLTLAGGANLTLTAGDVYINSLLLGDETTVSLDHNNYRIIIQNSANKGIVNVNNANGGTTFVEGTILGSKDTPLNIINFTNTGNDDTLIVGKNVSLYAANLTTENAGNGSFQFNAAGTNIVGGKVGTATSKFKNVTLTNGAIVQFSGPSYFVGDTSIDATSTLQIGDVYQANSITGAGPDQGTVEFVNTTPISPVLANDAANALSTIKMSGSDDVTLIKSFGASKIAFGNNSAGKKLTLAALDGLNGVTITSTAGNPIVNGVIQAPIVVTSKNNDSIAAGQAVGDAQNIVGIGLKGDLIFSVEEGPNFFGGIAPLVDGQSTVNLNAANNGQVYGLGLVNLKLNEVNVTTNTENFGNTRVNTLTVYDDITYTAGRVVDANITLGTANGKANVIFRNATNLLSTSAITAKVANNGTVTFLEDAVVNNIGVAGTSVASVAFIGPNHSIASLRGAIYSQNINFNGYDLVVSSPNAILSGASALNGEINLNTNSLTFDNGASTWGSNTSINTTLQNGTLGNIIIDDSAKVTAVGNVLSNVTINDQADLNSATQSYLFIKGGANLTFTNGGVVGDISNNRNGFIGYAITQVANKDYYLTRSNNSIAEVNKRLGGSSVSGLLDAGLALYNSNNTGDANKAANNFTYFSDNADYIQAVEAVGLVDNSVVKSTMNTTGAVADVVDNRVAKVRELGVPANSREAMLAAPEGGAVGAADDAEDNVSYGAWLQPFYKEETQKTKGGVAGYKAKTTGGLLGFDTMANDNLMIGAAIGVTKTDMKHRDYKTGDKSTINGFLFSLYGAQQLVDNFFFQGATTFSTNQVKNKSKRYMANTANGQKIQETANASYDNLTYSVEGMFGYDAKVMENLLVTPIAGIRYTKSSDESYKETGTTFQNKSVTSKFSDKTDAIFGARVIGEAMNLSQFTFYPEAHGFVTHKVAGKLAKIQSSLDGQATPFVGQSDKSAKTSYNLGLSVTTRPGPQMEYGIGYDANLASKYVAHQGTLKVRVNF